MAEDEPSEPRRGEEVPEPRRSETTNECLPVSGDKPEL